MKFVKGKRLLCGSNVKMTASAATRPLFELLLFNDETNFF
jgi:hypothetical protein